MPTYVRVAVNVPSSTGVFDYAVPESLVGRVQIGNLVVAPFGKQKVQAVVLRFIDQPAVGYSKEILYLVDPEPVVTRAQIALAEALSASTLSPLAAVVGLFLPPGLGQQADTLFRIREPEFESKAPASAPMLSGADPRKLNVAARLVQLLKKRGPLRGRQIDYQLNGLEWKSTARALIRVGMLSSEPVLPPARVRPRYVRTAELGVPPDVAEVALPDLGNTESTRARRERALRFLMQSPGMINVSWVYAESGCNLADLQEMAERELIVLRETQIWRDPLERMEIPPAQGRGVSLTDEQEAAWKQIAQGVEDAYSGRRIRPFLLQGVTGSGKTEIYMRAAEEAIGCGRQAIILVPEIALTPQTVQRFASRFPGQTGLIHSRLSEGERYDTWRRARAGSLKVIIGPRSALFVPLSNVGLIVLDECHDASYYQSEPPFYDAVKAAELYAGLCGAACILGSATPSVVQQYQAEIGTTVRLELRHRVSTDPDGGATQVLDLPPIHVVDMREELKAGNREILSRALHERLGTALKRGEQAILFMNRRGTATYVFCRICGHAMKCPRCETPLTQHAPSGSVLICHRCGYQRQMPRKCPECGNVSMRAYGLGTERVETEVQNSFPGVRTLRWDWETTREKDAHEVILSHFSAGRADVLIGTQMLAKGLDLPRVTLVGMVLADVGLYLPDPFAAERVFQLLTQVAGRAGRTLRGGTAVLQTYHPEHYAIQCAATHDVRCFADQELAQRRRLAYPPFSQLARLEFRNHNASRAEKAANALAIGLRKLIASENRKSVNLIGPAPCFISKIDGKYRWQIVLRGADLRSLLEGNIPPDCRVEVEPASLL